MRIFLFILPLFLFMSCSSTSQPVQKSNLTFANVKSNIVKGETSQVEIIKLLGSPNITSKNKQGEEVWSYSKQSSGSESGAVGGVGAGFGGSFGGLFGGSKAYSQTSTASFDLIITFDKNDIVRDYSVVSSKF